MRKKKIAIVVSTRSDYMKAAPLIKAFSEYPGIEASLIHTGQPYDDVSSKAFFKDLDLPDPLVFLGLGIGDQDKKADETTALLEKLLKKQKPALAVVFGDTNSDVAAARTASALSIPLAHVEAGLRSFDRTLQEEENRHLIDHLSDILFATSTYERANLEEEDIPANKIHMVGNIMIDTLAMNLNKALKVPTLEKFGLGENGRVKPYALLTLHLPSNVDDPSVLKNILNALKVVSKKITIIFPVHHRTLSRIHEFGFKKSMAVLTEGDRQSIAPKLGRIHMIPPQGYLNFLALTAHARLALTDVGGVQAETTYMGIPCLTLRKNTEWVITLKQGTNVLVGIDPENIKSESLKVLDSDPSSKAQPLHWDGSTASRMAWVLAAHLQ